MDKLTNRDAFCPALQAHCLQTGKLNTVIYKIMTRLLLFIHGKKEDDAINRKIQ